MPKVSEKVRSRIWSLQTQIGKGILDGTHDPEEYAAVLQNFLEKKREHHIPVASLTLEQASNILGQNKVITSEQATKAWGMEVPQSVTIRYGEATLRICAEQNKSGADWRLVYCHGLSLREQRQKRGVDQNNQPCFYNNDWWLKNAEDEWATHKPQAGYYLINFRGQFENKNWNQQEKEIFKLGKEYERCHEAVFSEAILTIFMANNGERIAADWWHWGVSLGSGGGRVSVGGFGAGGLGVDGRWVDDSGQRLRVCVFRKFEN